MNQVALPESQSDPEATPAVGMRARLLALAAVCVVGGLVLAAGLALYRASLEQRSVENGALTVARAIVGAADREIASLDRADGGPGYLAGAARGGSEGVLWSACRDAPARRSVVHPLGQGTAAAEHAPAIWRLPAEDRRLPSREPSRHPAYLRDAADPHQPGGLGSRGADIRHLGRGSRRGRRRGHPPVRYRPLGPAHRQGDRGASAAAGMARHPDRP